jgi:SAM-dependent methyltransferase
MSYYSDLAYIHDAAFTADLRSGAPALISLLRRSGIKNGLVVDIGCGSGVWAASLLKSGYDVLGTDFSQAMLKLARKRAPGARFVHGSFLDLAFPRCVAVTALGEVFNYEFERPTRISDLDRVFSRIYEALNPGGMFVSDMAGPGRLGGATTVRKHFQGKDWALLLEAEERRTSLLRHMTIFRRVGRTYRRTQEEHRQRLHPARDIVRILKAKGFSCQILPGFGPISFDPGRYGILAIKR